MEGLMIFILSLVSGLAVVSGSRAEKKLIGRLFHEDNHDKTIRPVMNGSDSLNVSIRLEMYQLIDIDEKNQFISLSAWVHRAWSDYQLKWDPKNYDGIKKISLDPKLLWTPDIVLINNIDEDNSGYGGNMDTLRTRVNVHYTGEVTWNSPVILKASCDITVKDFPYDTQKCFFIFGSWTYLLREINILSMGIQKDFYMQHSAWNLVYDKDTVTHLKYNTGVYADLTFHLHFQRKSMFHAANLIFPMAFITLLTIVSFILPFESGERIGFSVTLMLAATVFMLLVSESTPETSEGLPLVSIFFIFCMVLMFLIIIMLCYVSRMYSKGRTDQPMGKWTKRWILDSLSYALGTRHKERRNSLPVENKSSHFTNGGFTDIERKSSLKLDGRKTSGNNGSLRRRSFRSSSMGRSQARQMERFQQIQLERFQRLEELIMRVKTDETGDDGDGLTFEEEWRIVAMTVDRVLFFIFMISFGVGTAVCYARTKYVA